MLDYLIIGQGLAGSILAMQLLERGKKVRVLDNSQHLCASQVAAGMITPIAGKRLAKTWLVDECLPVAQTFYQYWEQKWKQSFFHPLEIQRFFNSEEQANRFTQKREHPDFVAYWGAHTPAQQFRPDTADEYGSVAIQHGGYVDTPSLLTAARQYLQGRESYQATCCDYSDFQISEKSVSYQSITAQAAIFCEGWQGKDNPWFDHLPFNCAQGDIVTVKTQQPPPLQILNRGKWLLPQTDQTIKIGASYTRDRLDGKPTAAAVEELCAVLHSLAPHLAEYEIRDHQAGIRPLTVDNRPFIGRHPLHKRVALFNGFGSKGTLWIPYFAEHFIKHLETGTPLQKEADINRHPLVPLK